MEQEFNTLLGTLNPILISLEEKRQELKSQGIRNGLIAGGICCLVGCTLSLCLGGGWVGIVVSLVLACIFLFALINSKSQELSAFYKKEIISKIVTNLCEGASFSPEEGIAQGVFENCGLFATTPDRYHSEDLISGQAGATAFICSEVHAEEKRVTTNGKGQTRTYWVDIFKGFLFIADFQKDFKGETVVYRNSWIKLSFGTQRVKLENPEFEKNFDVYSTDQVEARYLLTPSLMERLLALDRKFPGKITLSFQNSKVIIAIPDNTNHFEASIWQSILDETNLKREFDTLCQLIGIIEDLNLNLRIWTKE